MRLENYTGFFEDPPTGSDIPNVKLITKKKPKQQRKSVTLYKGLDNYIKKSGGKKI